MASYPSSFIGPLPRGGTRSSLQDEILKDSLSQQAGKSLQQFGAENRPSPSGQVLGSQAPSGGGDSRVTELQKMGSLNPIQQEELNRLLQAQPSQPSIDFDALIRPALEGLDAAIAPLTASTENRIGEIQQSSQTAQQQAQQSFGAQEQGLVSAKGEAKQAGESAADEARRQYAEIAQGQQARYGGTTGTGRFANEILGSQTMRNIADVRQKVIGAVTQLDEKLAQVKEVGRIAIQDIQQQTTSQIQQARDNLDLQLAEIRKQKGELQARKAELAANAIQIYQSQVQQVNASNAQFLQQIYQQQLAAQQQLEMAKQRAAQTASEIPELKFSTLNEGQSLVGYNPQTGSASNLYTAPSLTGGGSEFDQLLADIGLGGGSTGGKVAGTSSSGIGQLTPSLNKLGVGLGF